MVDRTSHHEIMRWFRNSQALLEVSIVVILVFIIDDVAGSGSGTGLGFLALLLLLGGPCVHIVSGYTVRGHPLFCYRYRDLLAALEGGHIFLIDRTGSRSSSSSRGSGGGRGSSGSSLSLLPLLFLSLGRVLLQ